MGAWVGFMAFLGLLALGYGLWGLKNQSYIKKQMSIEVVALAESEPFWENLWRYNGSGLSFDDIWKMSIISAAIGAGIGLVFQGPLLAAVAGLMAGILTPRGVVRLKKSAFTNRFNEQFPRSMRIFSAAARVMSLGNCAGQVALEAAEPSCLVFRYIDDEIKLNVPLYRSITQAAKEFDLPILEHLAEAVRTLDELGAGERAGELLESVAEEARFVQSHQRDIRTRFADLKATMGLATGIPVVVYALLLLDSGGIYRRTLHTDPWLVVLGLIVIAGGWLWARSLIKSAMETL